MLVLFFISIGILILILRIILIDIPNYRNILAIIRNIENNQNTNHNKIKILYRKLDNLENRFGNYLLE